MEGEDFQSHSSAEGFSTGSYDRVSRLRRIIGPISSGIQATGSLGTYIRMSSDSASSVYATTCHHVVSLPCVLSPPGAGQIQYNSCLYYGTNFWSRRIGYGV